MEKPQTDGRHASPWPLRLLAAVYGAWLVWLVVMAVLQKRTP